MGGFVCVRSSLCERVLAWVCVGVCVCVCGCVGEWVRVREGVCE